MKKYRYYKPPLTVREHAVFAAGVILAVIACLGSQMGHPEAISHQLWMY